MVVCLVLILLGLVALLGLHSAVRTPQSALRSPLSRVSAGPGRRSTILDRNGVVLAMDSTVSESGGKLERVYPLGETAANLIGFELSTETQKGAAGLELGVDSLLSRHQGRPVRVTIDAGLQRSVFQILQHYVSITRAARASAVAVSVATGEILTLADYPGYDPTKARMYPSEVWRCHAVTDEFAPGPLVGDWWLKTEGGRRVAEELGFGRQTGISLPDETAGVLADSLPATRVSLLQLVQAYSAIADDGRMNRPRLVATQAVGLLPPRHKNTKKEVLEPTLVGRMISELTRSKAGALEFAGAGGIAGPGCLDTSSLSAVMVFVGLFPASEPKYVVGVMLDRPLPGYYASETARLLFEDVARYVGGQ